MTERGNRFALAIICLFSKYSKSYTLKNKEAETVADQIAKHSMTFGIPDAALSDQGAEFHEAVRRLEESERNRSISCSPYFSIRKDSASSESSSKRSENESSVEKSLMWDSNEIKSSPKEVGNLSLDFLLFLNFILLVFSISFNLKVFFKFICFFWHLNLKSKFSIEEVVLSIDYFINTFLYYLYSIFFL